MNFPSPRDIAAICATAALCLSTAVHAETTPKPSSLLPEAVASAGVLRVAIPDQGMPYAYKVGADLKGMDADLAKEIATTLGLTPELSLVPFAAALTGLQAGKFDVSMGQFYIREERLAIADFITDWQTYNTFLSLKTSGHQPQDFADICGLKVAAMAGSAQLDGLQRNVATCADHPYEIAAFPAVGGALLALASGRVDLLYSDAGVAHDAKSANSALQSSGELGTGATSIAVARGAADTTLGQAVQAALTQMSKDGSYQKALEANGTGYGAVDAFTIHTASATPPHSQ